LHNLIDNELDLSIFGERIHNDESAKMSTSHGVIQGYDGIAFIADNHFRKRDVRLINAGMYKKKVVNWKPEKGKYYFTTDEFIIHPITGKLICPEGVLCG
jgi:hypothetical protein